MSSGQIVLWDKHADFVNFAKTVMGQTKFFLSYLRGLDAHLIALASNSAIMTFLCAPDHWSKASTFDGSPPIDCVLGPAANDLRRSLDDIERLLEAALAAVRAAKEASENNRSF